MDRVEFRKLIESIGFILLDGYNHIYKYKEYRINVFKRHYSLKNDSKMLYYNRLNDLEPIDNHFKKELRYIKLKALLK